MEKKKNMNRETKMTKKSYLCNVVKQFIVR